MKSIIPLILVLFFNFSSKNEFYIKKSIQKKVENNILIGRIVNRVNKDDFYSPIIEDLLPDKDWRLYLEYKIEDKMKLPDGYGLKFTLYSVHNHNFELINHKTKATTTHISTHTHGPDPIYQKYLIAVDEKQEFVVFVSGMFIRSEIADLFDMKIRKPETFHKFLSLKLYIYNISEIQFIKKDENYIYFKAYSEVLGNVAIKVSKDNFDKVTISN